MSEIPTSPPGPHHSNTPPPSALIFDAHLDLAMNALEWNRDLTRPVAEIREREQGLTDKAGSRAGARSPCRRCAAASVGLCVATLIARYVEAGRNPLPGWHSPAAGLGADAGAAGVVSRDGGGGRDGADPRRGGTGEASAWNAIDGPRRQSARRRARQLPIGYILSLEGADSIVTLKHLERAIEQGLRAVGPAHYGPGTYAQGTDATGGLGARGRELLAEMERLGIILDATHLCDDSFWEALDLFHGPVWASHPNCRALVPHNRQFSDEQIKALDRARRGHRRARSTPG